MIKMDGKALSLSLEAELKLKVDALREKNARIPKLVVVLVGDNPASQTYVKNKAKACERVGFLSEIIELDGSISQEIVLSTIDRLNRDETVDGILVQLPVPKHLDAKAIVHALDPNKDVDGLHPLNVAKLYENEKGFVPCTPKGIMRLLKEYQIDVVGKHCVVLGRSNLVGRPVAQLLLNENATVTICHSKTQNLSEFTKQADIIVVAIGRANFLTSKDVNHVECIIDVGINRVDGKLVGDVAYDELVDKVDAMTPVPGGVGPMTIGMLLENTLEAYTMHEGGSL
jgi:methylenetetrahydrofolate dehydrogenase (NADP+)/methenyltetrahydrofolate cyclohydrolase